MSVLGAGAWGVVHVWETLKLASGGGACQGPILAGGALVGGMGDGGALGARCNLVLHQWNMKLTTVTSVSGEVGTNQRLEMKGPDGARGVSPDGARGQNGPCQPRAWRRGRLIALAGRSSLGWERVRCRRMAKSGGVARREQCTSGGSITFIGRAEWPAVRADTRGTCGFRSRALRVSRADCESGGGHVAGGPEAVWRARG